jgi:hypothetical protein
MFYVTVINADRVGYLLGPYDTHEEALERVAEGRRRAEAADRWAHFYAFGTARSERVIKTVFGRGDA